MGPKSHFRSSGLDYCVYWNGRYCYWIILMSLSGFIIIRGYQFIKRLEFDTQWADLSLTKRRYCLIGLSIFGWIEKEVDLTRTTQNLGWDGMRWLISYLIIAKIIGLLQPELIAINDILQNHYLTWLHQISPTKKIYFIKPRYLRTRKWIMVWVSQPMKKKKIFIKHSFQGSGLRNLMLRW